MATENSHFVFQFTESLIGNQGILLNLLSTDKTHTLSTRNPLQICLIALKCIVSLVSTADEIKTADVLAPEVKKLISQTVVGLLMRGSTKSQDDFMYCKVCLIQLIVSCCYLGTRHKEYSMAIF